MNKSTISRLFTLAVAGLTTVQGMVATMPASDHTKTIISAIVMFLAVAVTAWKQYFDVEISNGAIIPTIIIAIVATLGGVNDLINIVPVSAAMGQWIRFSITGLSTVLSVCSKTLWPSYEGKKVEDLKQNLKQ